MSIHDTAFDLDLLTPEIETALDDLLDGQGLVEVGTEMVPMSSDIPYILLASPDMGLPHKGCAYLSDIEAELTFDVPHRYLGAVHFDPDGTITVYANVLGMLFPAWCSDS